MKFLKLILPVLVIFQIAFFAQSFSKSSVSTFAETKCKTREKNPLVTVECDCLCILDYDWKPCCGPGE